MRFGQIRKYDVANGIGIRTTIFCVGCTHNCYNCFNKEYQGFDAGDEWTDEHTQQIIEYLKLDEVEGLSLLGGEPFQNEKDLCSIVSEIKKNSDKSIWVWSGYTYEDIIQDEYRLKLLSLCDVLVDGKFVEAKKDLSLKFRGSSNQRLIDVQQSLQQGKVVLYEC